MPTVLRTSGFRFFFCSLEGAEQPRIHVEHGDNVAKFLLEPPVSVVASSGFRPDQLKRLRALVIKHRPTFLEAWNAHFSS
jgi:hypothetical protein